MQTPEIFLHSSSDYMRSGTRMPSSAIARLSTRATCSANCKRKARTTTLYSLRIE